MLLKAMNESLLREKYVSLGEKLAYFYQSLDSSESEFFRFLISGAATGLERLERTEMSFTQEQVMEVLIQSVLPKNGKSGILFFGYREFLNEPLLSSLIAESKSLRRFATRRIEGMGCAHFGGEVARNIAELLSKDINNKFTSNKFELDGEPSYLYYDSLGDGIGPHIDKGEFTINALIGVDYTVVQEFASSTFVYGVDGKRHNFIIKPGQVLIFDAGHLFHGRDAVGPGESVTILTIGLRQKNTLLNVED